MQMAAVTALSVGDNCKAIVQKIDPSNGPTPKPQKRTLYCDNDWIWYSLNISLMTRPSSGLRDQKSLRPEVITEIIEGVKWSREIFNVNDNNVARVSLFVYLITRDTEQKLAHCGDEAHELSRAEMRAWWAVSDQWWVRYEQSSGVSLSLSR